MKIRETVFKDKKDDCIILLWLTSFKTLLTVRNLLNMDLVTIVEGVSLLWTKLYRCTSLINTTLPLSTFI